MSLQGTESSVINYTGQVLSALMYFMLWEPAWRCSLQTHHSLLVRSPQCSPPSHFVTGALVLLPQSEFTHGGRVDSSLLPESNPARGHVLSLVLYTLKYTGRKRKNNESSHAFCYINSLLPPFVQMVSTNNIIVQCHYCESAAGNVSSAPFPASMRHSSTGRPPHHPVPTPSAY